jgi:cobalt-zinc-cadmium efflux system protein
MGPVVHRHPHGRGFGRAFAVGVAINLGFVVVEVLAGLLAGSLALLSDAAHNLGDVLGLLLAWGAGQLALRPRSARRTYGLRRGTILAALANAVLLLLAVGAIASEAIRRLGHPAPVAGMPVILVAAVGVVVNGATALLFRRDRHRDLNVRGAFLHMAADAGVSLGVVVGGLIIRTAGWTWLDPALSLAIGVVIAAGTWGLLRESLDLAMDAVPAGIDPVRVEAWLTALPGVIAVHDLHIWGMSTSEVALTAHLVACPGAVDDAALHRAAAGLQASFGIGHSTLQVEVGDPADGCCPADGDTV